MTKKNRNPYLTPGMEKLLRMMLDEAEKPDGEQLICSIPGGWWLGLHHIHAPTVFRLIRIVAISQDGGDFANRYTYWRVNGEGKKLIADLESTPEILEILRRRDPSHSIVRTLESRAKNEHRNDAD